MLFYDTELDILILYFASVLKKSLRDLILIYSLGLYKDIQGLNRRKGKVWNDESCRISVDIILYEEKKQSK